jgi:sugar phosphate isomerase/epimerase
MNQPIAIQSWCYRNFKPIPAFIEQLKNTGVTATELCGVHANFGDPATFAGVIEQFKKAGITLVAIGVETMTGDPATDKPRFEFCKAAGIKNISITFAPDAMFDAVKKFEKMADEYDINLGIHNHGGYDWLGNETILKHIFKNTSKRIGLHIDTAWAIDAKQDPTKWVETWPDRIHGVHVKDFIYTPKREPKDVIIGTGNLDLPKFMGALKKISFTGPLVIEYEGDVENPVPALKECVAALKKVM